MPDIAKELTPVGAAALTDSSEISILFIAPVSPPITGQSLACEALYKHLCHGGYRVILIDLSKKSFQQGVNSSKRILEIASVLIRVLWHSRRADLYYLTPAESLAGNLKDLLIYALCWRRLRRMVIHLHGGAGMRRLLSSEHPIVRRLNGFFLKRVGAVVVLGERLQSVYQGLVSEARLHTVANFAGDEFFIEVQDVRKKFSVVDPMRLLFLSNLLPGKGHQELLSALNLLTQQERAQIKVDIAGGFDKPEDEARLLRQIAEIKGTQVMLHGIVHGETKRDLLRKAHLFCLPTYYPYEGQPISILEAYASGCAVMTTNHSGIFDTFTPGRNGYEVTPRSAESIAEAIRHALNHPMLLQEWAQNNARQADQCYRRSTHVQMVESVLTSIQSKPRCEP